tara:strand:+ start:98 stop:499 length:402 start_codon:yes stop_codon:yes gene_type:complete
MKNILKNIPLCIFLASCASSTPMMVIDPASVTDGEKVVIDREECYQLAATIDMTDEVTGKALAGAAIGSAAVAGTAALAYGAVFAPAIPFIIAGGMVGGGLWGGSASEAETKYRNNILQQCMIDRGYKVYIAE